MPDGLDMSMDLAPLNRMLSQLDGPEVEQPIRKSLRAGGELMKAAIAAHAPIRVEGISSTALPPGALISDIQVNVGRERDGSFSAYIEPGKETMRVARWVEWGHRLVRGGRFSKGKGPGKQVGDVPAHPYIRPAFEANEGLAVEAMAEVLAVEITALAKRNGGA